MDQELIEMYKKTITEKMQILREICGKLRGHANKENVEALRFFVHKLKGSAGTYGFMDVSDVCGKWEKRLVKALEKDPVDTSWMRELGELEKLIDDGFKKEAA